MVAEGMQVAPVNFEESRRSVERRGGTIGRQRGSSNQERNSERLREPSLLQRKSRVRGGVKSRLSWNERVYCVERDARRWRPDRPQT